jgi:periplasmic protein TonB
MMALAADDVADLRRWAICGAVIVLAHGGLAAGIVNWGEPIEGTGAAAGIVIEFAPLPVAPATLRADIRPGPEQDTVDSPAVKPVESLEEKQKVEEMREAKLDSKIEEKVDTKPMEEPPPEVKPAPNPEVAVQPPPPQEVKQETPAPRQESPALVATAPEVIAEREAAVTAAPRQGIPNPYDSELARNWRSQLVAALLRNKRYPEAARSRGEQGVAQVFFSLDRQGRLLESRLVRSSGAASLDEEALALLRRAQPFPAPPSDWPGEHVDLNVPIRFNLK